MVAVLKDPIYLLMVYHKVFYIKIKIRNSNFLLDRHLTNASIEEQPSVKGVRKFHERKINTENPFYPLTPFFSLWLKQQNPLGHCSEDQGSEGDKS